MENNIYRNGALKTKLSFMFIVNDRKGFFQKSKIGKVEVFRGWCYECPTQVNRAWHEMLHEYVDQNRMLMF